MLRGLYAAASGMVSQMKNQETYAHNLANVDAVGFRGLRTTVGKFADSLATAWGVSTRTAGAVQATAAPINLADGPLVRTERTLDLALSGPGFFTIQTTQGLAYTRDGRFQIDNQRHLVTMRGHQVMGQAGPITLPVGEVTVDETGAVFCQGQKIDSLRLIEPLAPQPTGEGLYQAAQTRPALACTVNSGMLEQSNVNAMQEMTRMLNGFRLYEANVTALRYQDESLGTLQKIVE